MNEVSKRIREEIDAQGAITFARFMELALYCPNYGYYEREEDIIGSGGDYYTSVSVGSLFGELLAFQFAEWLSEVGRAEPDGEARPASAVLQIVEAGAHRGDLASDILTWLQQHRGNLFERLEYCIVEPSLRRQTMQRRRLDSFGRRVRWASDLVDVASRAFGGVRGVIFSNELFDAMPVRRFGWDAGARSWFEWGVTFAGDDLVWTRLDAGDSLRSGGERSLPEFLQPAVGTTLEALPDGFAAEWCPGAEEWWARAAAVLDLGKLMTIDYGLTNDELLLPARTAGTLKAIRGHRLCDSLLSAPGEQDLTAHVNFSRIQAAGELAGLKTDAFQTQAQFLTRIAEQAYSEGGGFGEWTSKRVREFQTLTHPEHLGRSFRVIVQSPARPVRRAPGAGDSVLS